jgi:agmatinase
MYIGTEFADATSSFSEARYVVMGVPVDITQSFRPGSRFAPSRIREASWNLESYSLEFELSLSEVPIHDCGDLAVEGSLKNILSHLSDVILKWLNEEKFPIVLGGDHSISIGTTGKLNNASVLIFDAHFDLRNEFDGTRFSHACVTKRLLDMMENGKIKEIILVGVRSGTREEKALADRTDGITYFTSTRIRKTGCGEVIDLLRSYDRIYISMDMDALDPSYAPGVSTPEPFGLTPWDVREILREIAKRSLGMDVVEVVPAYDTGVTSVLAARFVHDIIAMRESEI